MWCQKTHCLFPPAFRAAVKELLLISRKHGGSVQWPFTCDMLIELVIPRMARDVTAWP